MPQLHEILAVEKSTRGTAVSVTGDSIKTLGKDNLFQGRIKKTTMLDDAQSFQNTIEVQKLESTVDETLDYLIPYLSNAWDVVLQKDLTNQKAIADIVLEDGTVIAEGIPATFLLSLETRLTELRENVYKRLPTLLPGITWVPDEGNEKDNVFITPSPVVTFKVEKELDFQIVVPPTPQHRAEIKEVQKTVTTGKHELTQTSGMLPPVDKATRISRIDELLTAVKKARTRANETEIIRRKIGEKLFKFINDN